MLFEPGSNGSAALEQASELATGSGDKLAVVAVAPQDSVGRCCGASPAAFNCAVLDAVREELHEAARLLGPRADMASYTLLRQSEDPPLGAWLASRGVEVVFVPARRRLTRSPSHPAVRQLRRVSGCEVRVVARRRQS